MNLTILFPHQLNFVCIFCVVTQKLFFSLYRRFCRVTRKDIPVPIPDMVREYNSGMGGVDLLDNMVAVYRIPYRIKKWWFPIFTWSLR